MFNLILVGCGSLGSTFLTEVAKRSLATKLPLVIKVFDFDTIEERNVVAQNFDPQHIGQLKSHIMADILKHYEHLEVISVPKKVTEENYLKEFELDSKSIIIDAVDNVETRQLLWQAGLITNTPVLHMGMSEKGSGNVSWNFKSIDTFPLSPAKLTSRARKALKELKHDEKLAPCVLNSFRSLIFNTSIAGVDALFNFLAIDPAKQFEHIHNGHPYLGLVTNWNTSLNSFNHVPELIMSEAFGN